jgi:hypothetical protein
MIAAVRGRFSDVTGGVVVGDEVKISIDSQVVAKPA